MQTKKECQIELAHLKTHRDTARRLRAVVQREDKLQVDLREKQQHVATEMQEYAPPQILVLSGKGTPPFLEGSLSLRLLQSLLSGQVDFV